MPIQLVRCDLSWSGEHWVCMLRESGSTESTVVSHYHLRCSPVGPGNAAILPVSGPDGFHVLATDNEQAVAFARERFFAEKAELLLDGRNVPGQSFTRDIWRSSIGDDRSSCVYSLAETFIDTD